MLLWTLPSSCPWGRGSLRNVPRGRPSPPTAVLARRSAVPIMIRPPPRGTQTLHYCDVPSSSGRIAYENATSFGVHGSPFGGGGAAHVWGHERPWATCPETQAQAALHPWKSPGEVSLGERGRGSPPPPSPPRVNTHPLQWKHCTLALLRFHSVSSASMLCRGAQL